MDPSHITPLAAVATAVIASAFPIGDVNFNLPFEVFDQFSDEPVGAGKVIAILRGNAHPILVQFDDDGIENAILFDADGSSENGDYTIKNAVQIVYPYTVYGILIRDGNKDFNFDSDVYATEAEARQHTDRDAIVFPVVIPAPVSTADDDVVDSDIEEENDDEELDDGETSESVVDNADKAPGTIENKYFSGVGRHIAGGDTSLRAYRNGFGWCNVTVVKVREDYRKNFFVQADDGSASYWALNKNLSNRVS